MASGIAEKSLSFYARVAGISILLVVAAVIISNFFILGGIVVPDDAAATANSITDNDLLFRFAV